MGTSVVDGKVGRFFAKLIRARFLPFPVGSRDAVVPGGHVKTVPTPPLTYGSVHGSRWLIPIN